MYSEKGEKNILKSFKDLNDFENLEKNHIVL